MSPTEARLYTKSQIRKAGEILKEPGCHSEEELGWAFQVVQNYRSLFRVPLSTFNASLRERLKHRKIRAEFVAQRIKRLPTILDKLQRFKDMQLHRMQDIGGLRAVLPDMKALDALYQAYTGNQRKGRPFLHELIRKDDYVSFPKPSGYRGRHLVFRYHNEREEMSDFDGLTIEMQFRTKLQHIWATAVETFEAYLGEKFKYSMGNADWLEFFALLSSSFALEEKQPLVPAHCGMSQEQIHNAIREKVRQLNVLHYISTFSKVTSSLPHIKNQGAAYFVLIFDAKEKDSWVRVFKDYEQAYKIYSGEERRSREEPARQIVLVKLDSVSKLTRAYPNYFANLRELKVRLEYLMQNPRS